VIKSCVLTGLAWLAASLGAAEGAVEARPVAASGVVVFADRERTVAVYHPSLTPLPHVHDLLTPAGVNVIAGDTTHLPHPGHWGIFFGASIFADGRQYDFFHGRAAEVPASTLVSNDSSPGAAVSQILEWQAAAPGGNGKVLLREERRVVVPSWAGAPFALVEWETVLRCPPGTDQVEVNGYDFVGFGVRLRNPDGRLFSVRQECVPGANTRRFRDRWCAAAYEPEPGKMVTVAVFEHPGNTRRSAVWTALNRPFDFGYIGPGLCPGMGKDPLVVTPNRPARLRYAVAAWDGAVAPDTIDALCDTWLARTGAVLPDPAPREPPPPSAVPHDSVPLFDCVAAAAAVSWQPVTGEGLSAVSTNGTTAEMAQRGAGAARRLKLTFGGGRWPTLSRSTMLRDWVPFGAFHVEVRASRDCLALFRAMGPEGSRSYATAAPRNERW